MDSLVPPSPGDFERISQAQESREEEYRRRSREFHRRSLEYRHRRTESMGNSSAASASIAGEGGDGGEGLKTTDGRESAEKNAAGVIQRTYRGYRARREMEGFGLDASSRWMSAIQDARWMEATKPRPRSATSDDPTSGGVGSKPSMAKENWKKANTILRRAAYDIDSDSGTSSSSSSLSSSDSEMEPERRAARRKKHEEMNMKRKKQSRMMALQYFLEMVDQKHRYGSNLRAYHEVWKGADTNENFFYWLDYGDGKDVDIEACPRERLEREQVRYLSREERQYYLVQVDDEGRLRWAKNGAMIDTTENYRDSIHGIVPSDDPTPTYRASLSQTAIADHHAETSSSAESEAEADRAAKYATPELDKASGPKKIKHVSATTVFNRLLRKTVRKNTWIFVADTSFRLYVGIKDSGGFQHSSFLQGSRISAAGLIKIKNGRLSSLSPLSGHYRPPASSFRAFTKNLKEAGVDMSHVSISKSYAVLVGLEMYLKTRRKGKKFVRKATRRKDKLIDSDEFRRREVAEMDKSESAKRERVVLAEEEREEDAAKVTNRMLRKMHLKDQLDQETSK